MWLEMMVEVHAYIEMHVGRIAKSLAGTVIRHLQVILHERRGRKNAATTLERTHMHSLNQ